MKWPVLVALTLLGCAHPPTPAALPDGAAPDSDTPSGAPAVRYLALGDSFTIGTGTTPDRSFPARLASRWQSAGCNAVVKNLGVNGYTTDDVLDGELPEVARFA